MTYNLYYYLVLFTLIFLIRFIKVRKNIPKNSRHISDYFLIGQELVYISAGIVILLLESVKVGVGFIFSLYVLVVYASTAIEGLDVANESKLIAGFNYAIIIFIIAGTVFTYAVYLPELEEKSEPVHTNYKLDSVRNYKVVIPYEDVSLKKNVGFEKFKNRKLVYITTVESKNDSTVIMDALYQFENDSLFFPLYPDVKGVVSPLIRVDKQNILKSEIGF